MARPRDEDPPFPPLPVARFFAYGLSIAAMPLLWLWLGPETPDRDADNRALLGAALFMGSLIPAWLAYIWTGQEHFDHATVAFVLAVALFVGSLLVTYA